jgi:hypothetical protein
MTAFLCLPDSRGLISTIHAVQKKPALVGKTASANGFGRRSFHGVDSSGKPEDHRLLFW